MDAALRPWFNRIAPSTQVAANRHRQQGSGPFDVASSTISNMPRISVTATCSILLGQGKMVQYAALYAAKLL
jgi:hypothetical protein